MHRRLTFAAQEWQRHGRTQTLYRGVRLAGAQALQRRQPDRLNGVESEFLRASEAEQRSHTARRRRRTSAVAALTAALAVISAIALVAVDQGRRPSATDVACPGSWRSAFNAWQPTRR